MNTYGQYCPLAKAVEIVGDRWTFLIIRDIFCGTHHFNALERGLPGIPRALLTERLKRLQQAGILERIKEPESPKTSYQLTPSGLDLYPVLEVLTRWGAKWAFGDPQESDLDPVLLLWWMHNRVNRDLLPSHRVVVEFDFMETRPKRFWLVLKPEDVSICVQHPGYEIDMLVTAELAAFFKVWVGKITFDHALNEGSISLDALPHLIQAFAGWFALSPIAEIVRNTLESPVFSSAIEK